MSLFARGNRRKQQEPPSSVDFGYTRRRKPIDPPCTLKREEKEPKIELSEHQLELRKQKSRDSDNYQENSCTQTSDHGAPILYDDEGEIVLDENAIGPRVYGTEDVIRTERSVTKETKSSSAPSRALSHAVTMEPATKAKAAPRQSSNQDIQRPFMTRSNQAKTEPKQAEPARTHTSSKNIALASLMSRSAARGPVSKRNSKQTSTENGTNKVNESTQPSKSNHTKLGSLSTVSSSTSASEEQKAVLRQMLGNTTIDKHSHGTRPSGKAKSLSTSNSSSASNSTFDSNVRKSEPPSDTGKEILRGYMKKVAHQSSSRLAFTVGHENNYVKSRDKEETKSASKAVYDTVVESEADASIVIQKKKSGSFDEASVQSGRSGSNKSKTTTSSSGKNALLQKVLARTISKATSNKDGERESPRGKLNPRTKHLKMASGSPRSDAESSLVISKASESVSDSKSSKDSRLESAAVSLSQKVLKSSSKSFSPKGRGLKGIFKNRIGRSKKQDTVQKSNPITEPSENTLAKASSADSGNTLNGGVSFRSVDETVDETLDSTVDSSYKGSQKQKVTNSQLATTSYESEEARPTLGASSTLSENSGNASFGPAPYVSKAYEGSKNIVASATTDTEESSAIMVNLQSASIDSMQYSTEESYDEDLYLSKTQPSTSSESQRGPNHSLLVKPSQQDAEPKGYVDFVEALRAEASGAHLQVRPRHF